MNVDAPDALITVRPTAHPLGPILGRAFMLSGKLPEELASCVRRLAGGPHLSDSHGTSGAPKPRD